MQSLLVQLERLQEISSTAGVSNDNNLDSTNLLHVPANDDGMPDSSANLPPLESLQNDPVTLSAMDVNNKPSSDDLSRDKHYRFGAMSDTVRFFGSSSVLNLTTFVLQFAERNSLISPQDVSTHRPSLGPSDPSCQETPSSPPLAKETIQTHIKAFFASFGFLGFIDATTIEQHDLPTYMTTRQNKTRSSELHGQTAYQYFFISMICAVGCASRARHHPQLAVSSVLFYEDAKACIEEVTSTVSAQSLQALLLLTCHCLFYPTEGDVWRLLGFCSRLCVELGYHAEPVEATMAGTAAASFQRATFRTVYVLEKLVSQTLGRCSDLPESIVTIALPAPESVTGPTTMLYRLLQLRSRIYDTLYMPALAPEVHVGWYERQHNDLSAWKTEFDAQTGADVPSLLSETLYHSTICLLFQSQLMSALNNHSTPHTLTQNNYTSACALIRHYSRILSAPEDSADGSYPFTFISSHSAFSAAMTIMAHALLSLFRSAEVEIGQKFDFKELWEVSNSALLLLAWCAERWPGMRCVVDWYKRLADRVLPLMFRRGLI